MALHYLICMKTFPRIYQQQKLINNPMIVYSFFIYFYRIKQDTDIGFASDASVIYE